MNLLELRGFHAGYSDVPVLKGVTIAVRSGEIVALIGPNGAGKSTVLKAVYGLATRTAGSVKFGGRSVAGVQGWQLRSLGIAFIPQGRVNFWNMTVMENIVLGCLDEPAAVRHARVAEVWRRFPVLLEKRKQYAFSLSGGEQQMLAIARTLVQKPKLLLMDEPSLGLSPKLQQELFALIASLRQEGVAVLLVEQNAKQAIAIADRTYLLEQGKVVLSGGKTILNNKKIKAVYLGGA